MHTRDTLVIGYNCRIIYKIEFSFTQQTLVDDGQITRGGKILYTEIGQEFGYSAGERGFSKNNALTDSRFVHQSNVNRREMN